MPTLLIVHHTPSPATQELLETVIAAANDDALAGLEVITRAALGAGPADVLIADGLILGTPANIGYMSGAMKHFFDQVFYPCLNETAGLPYGTYIHGNSETAGAVRAVDKIAGGMGWRKVSEPSEVTGGPGKSDLVRLTDLTQAVAAHALGLVDP